MEVTKFHSKCTPKFNTRILRGIDALTIGFDSEFPNGFEAIVEIQNEGSDHPYYKLIAQNDNGCVISAAKQKMNFLWRFSERSFSGYQRIDNLLEDLQKLKIHETNHELYDSIVKLTAIRCMTNRQHDSLHKLASVSAWHGAIRLPYNMLTTSYSEKANGQTVKQAKGEIRVSFSGANEWQDLFFAFSIMRLVQRAMIKQWKENQINFDVSGLKDAEDRAISFWAKTLPLWSCCPK